MVMAAEKSGTRQKILAAAAEIARESGPGNLSLDAVAAKAGVSKGGLLYHFPSKTALFRAVVESFVLSFEDELSLRQQEKGDRPGALMEAFVDLFVEDHDCSRPPPSGLLAALSLDPGHQRPGPGDRRVPRRARRAQPEPAQPRHHHRRGVRGRGGEAEEHRRHARLITRA
jgi:AcrR family transcriptional regulator